VLTIVSVFWGGEGVDKCILWLSFANLFSVSATGVIGGDEDDEDGSH
jgi:hypothetical protein